MSAASLAVREPIDLIDHARLLDRWRAGDVFLELRADSAASRAAALDALLGEIGGTKLIWIGNPLRSALSVERIILQAAGPEADPLIERSPAELATLLRGAAEGAARCLFIVHQPETLNPEARDTLARIAPLLSDGDTLLQFLFCGSRSFRPITSDLPAPPTSPPPSEAEPATRERRWRVPLVVLFLAMIGTLVTTSVAPSPRWTETGGALPMSSVVETEPRLDVDGLRREINAILVPQAMRAELISAQRGGAALEELLDARSEIEDLDPTDR